MTDVSLQQLKDKFASSEWPEFTSFVAGGDKCSMKIKIYPEIRWFEGHFPNQPVLAGVVQTNWAGEIGKYIFSVEQPFSRIDNLKFQAVILPGYEIDLELEYISNKNTIKFCFQENETTYSEGRLVFG